MITCRDDLALKIWETDVDRMCNRVMSLRLGEKHVLYVYWIFYSSFYYSRLKCSMDENSTTLEDNVSNSHLS